MNVTERDPREFDHPELDGLLRTFFRSEMPDPWPGLKAPIEAKFPPARPRRWHSIRGKLALAASVALLMVGSWCLSGSTPDYSQGPESPAGDPGNADTRFLKDLLNSKKPNVTPKKSSVPNNKGCSACDCCE